MTTTTKPRPLKLAPAKLPKGYAALCDLLGYHPAEVVRARFQAWCFEREIPLYDPEQVEDYLGHKADKERAMVRWAELRHYPAVIPISVLAKAGHILADWPGTKFKIGFVGPDPFAEARVHDVRFIFAAWDEPGFSG
jgi:hypothetical protein